MSGENRYLVCAGCGRRADPASTPVYYDFQTGQNYCERCRPGSPAAPAKKQPLWASILRILFGLSFLAVCVDFFREGEMSTGLLSAAMGLALLLWQFWPQLKALLSGARRRKRLHQNSEAARVREAERVKVCSHCGGSGTGNTCPYCGMPY